MRYNVYVVTAAQFVADLYAALAKNWVAAGCFAHFALLPTSDPALLGAWHALSFGIEQVYGLATLSRLDLDFAPPPPGVEMRPCCALSGMEAGPDCPEVLVFKV